MESIIIQNKNESVLDVLTLALQMEGFEVMPINTCDEELILKLIDDVRPHVVVLDIRLSDQDCIDACKLIKKKHPYLPVVALSSNNNIHEQYNKNGFDGYIKKPFDLDLLYKTLRAHISPTKY